MNFYIAKPVGYFSGNYVQIINNCMSDKVDDLDRILYVGGAQLDIEELIESPSLIDGSQKRMHSIWLFLRMK